MYTLRNFASNGDALGGEHTLNVIMDPNYCSMVGYATMLVEPSASRRDVHWSLSGTAVPLQSLNVSLEPINGVLAGPAVTYTWMPPAMINPGEANQVPTLTVSTQNVEDEVLNLQGVFFLFDIRARESSIYAHLIAARGGMYNNPPTT